MIVAVLGKLKDRVEQWGLDSIRRWVGWGWGWGWKQGWGLGEGRG